MSSNPSQSKERQSNKKKPNTLSPPESNDGPRGSILKKSAKYEVGNQSDTKPVTTIGTTKIDGTKKKETKAGKATFSEELYQVKEVDNWKKYNVEDGTYSKSCCNVF